MTVSDLLSYCRANDIELVVENGALRTRPGREALPPEVKDAMDNHAGELFTLLGAPHQPLRTPPGAGRRSGREAPLSFSQSRIWFLHQMEPDGSSYNVPTTLRLRGPLDRDVLQEALDVVVSRHEVLRTTFSSRDGTPVQLIGEPTSMALPVDDLSGLPPERREVRADQVARREFQRPFDLERGPLVRVRLLRLGADEHVLLVTMHHIVSDGWSLGVFTRELGQCYGGLRRGGPSGLSELPLQYADFALWQRQWLQGEELRRQLSYWKDRLRGLPTLELPTDHPRPVVQSSRGASWQVDLSEELSRGLGEISRGEGATLFMTMLAAFMVLLHRCTGQAEVVVGSPIANRNRAETEGLIGAFVNMLVMRAEIRGQMSFREVLGRVRETALQAYAHQDLPFEKLVEELDPQRDAGRNPLFQVVFALQNLPGAPTEFGDMTVQSVAAENQTTRFDLETYMWEGPRGLQLRVLYAAELFDAARIRGMFDCYVRLLQQVAAEPDRAVQDLRLLGEEEQRRLAALGRGRTSVLPQATVHGLFEQQALKRPQAAALEFQGRRVSYGELNARANQAAHMLRQQGVGPEVLVGVCMPRGVEMVVGMLGVLKAGGAYLPLDPEYPRERLAFMLEDAQVGLVLSAGGTEDRLPQDRVRVIGIDGEKDGEPLHGQSRDNPSGGAHGGSLAYVIYTSGSTGAPKGVMIEHRSLLNLVRWHNRVFKVRPADRATLLAAVSFDAAVWELWPYLAAGAAVVMSDTAVSKSPRELMQWLCTVRASISFMATPIAEMFVEEKPEQGLCLRILLTGGDVLHRHPRHPLPYQLVNNYGPTENTVVTTWTDVDDAPDDGAAPPIGRPVDNVIVHVLDSDGQPAPRGTIGELFIGGAGLARGYLNRPELTAERFVSDPFSEPGARLYRTGDMVKWRADGLLEFVGRVDTQVKIRGFRVELGEVERVLSGHPRVRAAAASTFGGPGSDKRLSAYVTLRPGESMDPRELPAWLRMKLPEHMIPSRILVLPELPLSSAGKVDRAALPAVPALPALPAVPRGGSSGAAPHPSTAGGWGAQNELGRSIAGIWSEVLGVADVDADENFFDLGGHSLLMMQVQAKVLERTGTRVTMVDLFRYPTVNALCEHIAVGRGGELT